MGGLWMQIFLLINVFFLGALIMTIFLFLRARNKEKNLPKNNKSQPLLPHATWQKIVSDAEREYKKLFNKPTMNYNESFVLAPAICTKKLPASA